MKAPIPQDWSGEWECVQISWPKSPEWTGILLGLLTAVGRGRYWDERTGSILGVQAIAEQIFIKNYPLISCAGDEVSLPPLSVVQMSSGSEEESEEEMSAVTWLSIEDGVLYMHFGPCCKVAIDGDFTTIIEPPPDGVVPDPEDPTTWACNKAYGMAETLQAVMVDLLAAISGLSTGYRATPAHAILEPFGSTWERTQYVVQAYEDDTDEIDALVADGNTKDWLACTWSPNLVATDNLSDAEFALMRTIAPLPFSVLDHLFVRAMLDAMSASTMAWWARMRHATVADCACPEAPGGPLDPVAGGWYLGELRSDTFAYTDTKEDSYTQVCFVPEHDVYGLFSWADLVSQVGGFNRWSKMGSTGGCAHDFMLTAHAGTFNGTIAEMDNQMDETPSTTLYDAMETDKDYNQTTLGPRSKIVGSPIATGGQTLQCQWFAQATGGGSGVITISYRAIHNTGSPSHS